MKKLVIPSVQKFDSAADFFQKFIDENKAQHSFFSFRYFANRIGWPSSYLSDVAKKRKKLSIKRAQEFARHFKLSTLDQERLIWFSMADKREPEAKTFATAKLKQKAKDVLRPTVKVDDIVQHHLISDILLLLKFTRKKMSATELKNAFEIGGFSLQDIEKALSFIQKNQLLSWDKQGNLTKVNGDIAGFDNHNETDGKNYVGLEIHQKFAENFLEFIKNPKMPSAYNSGFVEIKKDQFMTIALRIIELRNWILEISAQNQQDLNPTDPRRMMQFNLDFFSIKK